MRIPGALTLLALATISTLHHRHFATISPASTNFQLSEGMLLSVKTACIVSQEGYGALVPLMGESYSHCILISIHKPLIVRRKPDRLVQDRIKRIMLLN